MAASKHDELLAGTSPGCLATADERCFARQHAARGSPTLVDPAEHVIDRHPDVVEEPDKPNLDRRMKVFEFYLQAKWYDRVEPMLKKWEKDFADDKEAKKRIDAVGISVTM